MIDNWNELEAALQRAVELMGEPPEPGTREHEAFLALLRDIEINNGRIQAEAQKGPMARERAALSQHLADYSRRFRTEEELAREHKEGKGTTTHAII
jgi:hypothetical protein